MIVFQIDRTNFHLSIFTLRTTHIRALHLVPRITSLIRFPILQFFKFNGVIPNLPPFRQMNKRDDGLLLRECL